MGKDKSNQNYQESSAEAAGTSSLKGFFGPFFFEKILISFLDINLKMA